MAPFQTKLGGNDTLHIVVACGPFTTNDNLAYEPFKVRTTCRINPIPPMEGYTFCHGVYDFFPSY